MKKTILSLLILAVIVIVSMNNSYGSSIHKPVNNLAGYSTLNYLKVSEIIKLSPKEFGELTGKKMNVWERASFAIAKITMKHDLRKNPNLTLLDYTSSGTLSHTAAKVLKILYWVLIGLLLAFLLLVTAAKKQH